MITMLPLAHKGKVLYVRRNKGHLQLRVLQDKRIEVFTASVKYPVPFLLPGIRKKLPVATSCGESREIGSFCLRVAMRKMPCLHGHLTNAATVRSFASDLNFI
jgi:hypothetical protein